MKLGNYEIKNPLILGPMAGVTDWAFRTICAELGANITVTEMVSSRALVYKDKKSAKLLRKNEGSLCGAQIFGNDPRLWRRVPGWLWKFPAVIFWISIWAALCPRSPIPVMAAA